MKTPTPSEKLAELTREVEALDRKDRVGIGCMPSKWQVVSPG